jgi:hypothetical protein
MGLIAEIYRAEGRDCTLNGWSSQHNTVCVINAEGPFEPSDFRPGVLIVRHPTLLSLHAISVQHHAAGKWTMMGGNFLHTSDSRFGELCRRLLEQDNWMKFDRYFSYGAVPIHDRIEG